MKTQDNNPLTIDDLNSWEQRVAKIFTDNGWPEPTFGDKAGQTSVRFSNKRSSEQQNTSRQENK